MIKNNIISNTIEINENEVYEVLIEINKLWFKKNKIILWEEQLIYIKTNIQNFKKTEQYEKLYTNDEEEIFDWTWYYNINNYWKKYIEYITKDNKKDWYIYNKNDKFTGKFEILLNYNNNIGLCFYNWLNLEYVYKFLYSRIFAIQFIKTIKLFINN